LVKALPVIRRVKAIGLPLRGWAADVFARYGRWTNATRLPLSFFATRLRASSGATLVQRLEHVHHHWLSTHFNINLAVDQRALRFDMTQVLAAGPMLLRTTRALQQIELPARPRVYLERYGRHLGRSVRPAAFDLAARGLPAAVTTSIVTVPKMIQREPSQPPALRQKALAGHRQMTPAEVPLSPPRMQLRRAARIIAAMPDVPQLPAVAPWRPPEAGTARGPDPVVPMIAVDQLAGQVLREIDRRITARRERMGQR
jgi:hypothetical protein